MLYKGVYKRPFYEDSQNVVDQQIIKPTSIATTTRTAMSDDKLKF